MKERPILFSAPMVRAILDGTKTQTRRIAPISRLDIRQQDGGMVTWSVAFSKPVKGVLSSHSGGKFSTDQACRIVASQFCPYGQPGDRLWVRETWMDLQGTGVEHRDLDGKLQRYAYGADTRPGSSGDECRKDFGLKWRPSIHMPRCASRITLEITGVRVERLNDCSDADAIEEGVDRTNTSITGYATERYRRLWEQINGAGSWDANPWVWVLEFKRLEAA